MAQPITGSRLMRARSEIDSIHDCIETVARYEGKIPKTDLCQLLKRMTLTLGELLSMLEELSSKRR